MNETPDSGVSVVRVIRSHVRVRVDGEFPHVHPALVRISGYRRACHPWSRICARSHRHSSSGKPLRNRSVLASRWKALS